MKQQKHNFVKNKKFLKIFIPVMGTTIFLSGFVPMVCLATKSAYLKIDSDQMGKYIKPQEPAIFEFKKNNKNIKTNNLRCNWSYMLSSHKNIKITTILVEESKKDPNKILIETKITKQDGKPVQSGDCICFKLKFTYNDGINQWIQSFANISIFVTESEEVA